MTARELIEMTARELIEAVGSTVELKLSAMNDVTIFARVLDAQERWGMPRLLVEPVAGSGQTWINLDRVVRVVQPAALAVRA